MKCPHCETEIDEHEAGRCLDEWVAGAIFNDPRPLPGDAGILVPYNARLPDYSTDIAAAWRVAGRMRANGLTLGLENECAADCVHVIFRTAVELDVEKERVHSSRGEAPLAMCRAALKASA